MYFQMMKLVFSAICVLLFHLQSCSSILSEAELCLLNRVDYTPCDYRYDKTERPDDNQYGIYGTKIVLPNGVDFSCLIKNKNHIVKELNINGDDPLIKYIFSPGLELPNVTESYGDQQYVNYKVKCPANHSASFIVTEMELETPNCLDPADNEIKCVDYLRVTYKDEVADYGSIESCGNNSEAFEIAEIATNSLDILFRTSDSGSYPGFCAVVICVDTNPSNINDAEPLKRKKRTLHENLLERLSRAARSSCTSQERRNKTIIQFGDIVLYHRTKLSIIRRGTALQVFSGIVLLELIDRNGVLRRIRRPTDPVSFNGAGTLTINGCTANYKNYIVDPRIVRPLTREKRAFIRDLVRAHFNAFNLENADERLCPSMLDRPPFSLDNITLSDDFDDYENSTILECPKPNMTRVEPTCNWSDKDLLLTLNTEADNLVVKTLKNVVLRCTDKNQPGRITSLIERTTPLNVTCSKGDILDKKYLVTCLSNRKYDLIIEKCSVYCESTKKSIELDTCEYPSFRLPTNLTPGSKLLILSLVDGYGQQVDVKLKFDVDELDQYGYPKYCLLAQTDYEFEHSKKPTPQPKINEFGIYSTHCETESGEPACFIRRKGSKISAISNAGRYPQFKIIYSPGYRYMYNYRNSLYAVHNISCPDGYTAHLKFQTFALEGKSCFNYQENKFECVDFVRVEIPGESSTEFCGNSIPDLTTINPIDSNFRILFNSNDKKRFPGFSATILCIN